MTLIFLDIIVTIVQSVAFSYIVSYCVSEKNRIDKIKTLFMIIILIIVGQLFTGTYGENLGIDILLTHLFSLFIVILFYRKNVIGAITAYSIIYSILGLYSIIFGNIVFEYVKGILPLGYINYEKIFLIYIPELILMFICFKYINKINKVYKITMYEKFSITTLIMSFILDFIVVFYVVTLVNDSQLIKNIIYITFFLFFIAILIYFGKIHQKSEQILELNKSLEAKNSELRKIKHDYGAQISYLYGLCLMERFDDLKKSLKDIINNNNSTPTAVEISRDQSSVLSIALKPAIDTGIHVIIEDNCDFSLINMSQMELYRVISNIVNNAIKAMNSKGIIVAKSYEYSNSVVIKVQNNGPKIPEHQLKDIFKEGFTTKVNEDKSHGYGLSIVKDLVESYNGKVYVKSDDIATEFKIVLPIK